MLTVSPSLIENIFTEELFDYFEKHIIEDTHFYLHDDDSCVPFDFLAHKNWHTSFERTKQQIAITKTTLVVAEAIKLFHSEQSKKAFLFWRFYGDTKIIAKELITLLGKTSDIKINNSWLGLRWLIEKLHPERAPPKVLTSEYFHLY